MPQLKPEDPDIMITQALNAGDLDGALALYEPEAVLVTEPGGGKVARGTDAIRQFFSDFIAMKPKARTEVDLAVRVGDIALTGCTGLLKPPAPMAAQSTRRDGA